jgi:uncharacterized protein (DUF1015 family)
MPVVAPFRGLYYDPRKVPDLSLVTTPPYDVITPEERRKYAARDPHNVVHLILPEETAGKDKYRYAAEQLQQWQDEGILIREQRPAIYAYEQIFTDTGDIERKRRGVIALVKLAHFDTGDILPHERTTPEPVEDRLRLMEACGANLSQVFALYSDPTGVSDDLLGVTWSTAPRHEMCDDGRVIHRLWCVDEPNVISEYLQSLEGKTLLIADGHHRYTTALTLRDRMRARYPDATDRAAFEYVMMYLTRMESKGLVIQPTHRVIPLSHHCAARKVLDTIARYFSIEYFVFRTKMEESRAREKLFAAMDRSDPEDVTIGMYVKDERHYQLLTLEPSVQLDDMVTVYAPIVRKLDVAVLDGYLLREVVKVPESQVGLTKNRNEALDWVKGGDYSMAFLVRPPTVEQVRRVAEAGEVMPRKSTYFEPKVASGLVVNRIVPGEEIAFP